MRGFEGIYSSSCEKGRQPVFARANRHESCLLFYPAQTFVRLQCREAKTAACFKLPRSKASARTPFTAAFHGREKAGTAKLALDFLACDGRQ
jgi:hypothetical protein